MNPLVFMFSQSFLTFSRTDVIIKKYLREWPVSSPNESKGYMPRDADLSLFMVLYFLVLVMEKGFPHTVIFAKLSYNPDACPVCRTINENYSIIQNGTKTSNIKILPINGDSAFLRVQKLKYSISL